MSKFKVVFVVLSFVGIAGLAASGQVDVGPIVSIALAVGTGITSLIGFIRKK